MRKAWPLIAALVLGCSKAQLPLQPSTTPSPHATLRVTAIAADGTAIERAEVYLDGVRAGTTPYSNYELAPGRRALRLMKPGYRVFTESLQVEENTRYDLEAVLLLLGPTRGELFIAIDQDEARITVFDLEQNIISQSEAREVALLLQPGGYFVAAEKTGFSKSVVAVEVQAGEVSVVNLQLQPQSTPQPPVIMISLPDSAHIGETFTVRWTTVNATRVEVDFIANAGLQGAAQLQFAQSGWHYVRAVAYNGDLWRAAVDSIFIYESVPAQPQPPTIYLTVNPDTISVGEKINLAWRSTNATLVNVDYVPQAALNGSAQVQLDVPGNQVICAKAFGLGGQAVAQVAVFVHEVTAPQLTFTISPDTIVIGLSAVLRWQTNGYKVIIDRGIGARGPIGEEEINFNTPGDKIFTATAYGARDLTTSRQAMVYVKEATPPPLAAPELTFTISPDTVEFGQPAVLRWQTNGYQVIIDRGIGARGPIGEEEINFSTPGDKIFTATAYGARDLTTSRQAAVYVKEAPQPLLPVILLSVTEKVNVNTPATVSWFSQNADYVVVDYVGSAGSSGSVQINFATPGIRLITATAYNRAGYVSATDTIEVVAQAVEPSVADIIAPASATVLANQGAAGYSNLNAASVQIQTPGYYRIFSEAWFNSGNDQKNESFYLLVRLSNGTVSSPREGNAGVYFVVADEAGPPHTSTRDSGTFYFDAGVNVIEMHHYAKIAGAYPQFLNGPIEGPESVSVLGFRLTYVGQ